MAQQQPVVPKFGDWDMNGENFTCIFENARAEKGTQRVNPASSLSNSFSSEQNGRDTRIEPANLVSDRKPVAVSPSPSPVRSPLSNRAEKNCKRVNAINSCSTSSSEQDVKSSSTELGNVSFDRKSIGASSSSSPRLNPLSNRAYNRKDYEYISTFPRPVRGGYGANKNLGAAVSDASTLSLSTDDLCDYSATSWDSLKDKKYQQMSDTQTESDIPDGPEEAQLSEGCSDSDVILEEDKRPPLSPVHNQEHSENRGDDESVPAPARRMAGEAAGQGKFRGLLAGPGPYASPAALPKFGDWNASKPYTQIFGQHREEKLGGHPLQPLSLQAEMADNTKSAAPQRKQWLERVLCFKASAVKE